MRLVKPGFRALIVVAVALVAPSTAVARTASTADMSINWQGGVQGGIVPRAGSPFALLVHLLNLGPDAGNVRIDIQMPAGVRWVGGEAKCSQDGQALRCEEHVAPSGEEIGRLVSFIADTPGDATFVVSLDNLSATDPNLSNNSQAFTVAVKETLATAGSLALTPAKPRAGSPFVASFTVHGVPIESVRCKTSMGTVSARRPIGSVAACVIRTSRSARGRIIRGSVTAVVGNTVLSRQFSSRLR